MLTRSVQRNQNAKIAKEATTKEVQTQRRHARRAQMVSTRPLRCQPATTVPQGILQTPQRMSARNAQRGTTRPEPASIHVQAVQRVSTAARPQAQSAHRVLLGTSREKPRRPRVLPAPSANMRTLPARRRAFSVQQGLFRTKCDHQFLLHGMLARILQRCSGSIGVPHLPVRLV